MQQHFEVAIIGAGPAGISAATNASFHGISHILIEKGEVANTIFDYQLNKHVMAEPARLPLRARCRFEAGSREQILDQFRHDLEGSKVNFIKAEVGSVTKSGEIFTISFKSYLNGYSEERTCTASKIVLASGVQGTPRKLTVPGSELPHVAYTLADASRFNGQSIVVVGAGDAAIENALALSKNNSVCILNRGGEFARAKDGNARAILKAISTGVVRCIYNAGLNRIEGDRIFVEAPEGELEVTCNHLIARLGGVPPRSFLESIGVELPSKEASALPVVDGNYESSVPGLFIIGALIGYPLIKQAMNQGYEVIEYLRGEAVDPADQPLLEERFAGLPGGFKDNFNLIPEKLKIFKDLAAPQLREMVIESTLHYKSEGAVVFERNDYTDTFWGVLRGGVVVELSEGRSVSLGEGDFFGEMGLLSGRRRVATVKVRQDDTLLLEVPRKQMIKLMSSVASLRIALDELFMARALRAAIFPDAPKSFLDALVSSASMKHLKKGEDLFREGDVGDKLFLIRKGSVKVSRRNRNGQDVAQTYVPAGHLVGEMAVLNQEPTSRIATVTAAVGCDVISLDKSDVHRCFADFPAAREHVSRIADQRRAHNVILDWNDRSGSLLEFMMREGLTDAENVLLIDSDLCIGCDNCESACAATHGGYSRLDRKGGKSFAAIQIPVSCRHCENPLCMLDCPPDALIRQSNGEVVIRDSCIGCGNCVSNCPYGVIKLVYDKPPGKSSLRSLLRSLFRETVDTLGPAKAAKCDMCHELAGGAACVRACPTGAAMRVNPSKLVEIAASKRITGAR